VWVEVGKSGIVGFEPVTAQARCGASLILHETYSLALTLSLVLYNELPLGTKPSMAPKRVIHTLARVRTIQEGALVA
jgi:hypothetical protein